MKQTSSSSIPANKTEASSKNAKPVDKRGIAREQHSNDFTNRADAKGS